MKRLFIALICTAIGLSASASDLNAKKNSPSVIKTEVTTTSGENVKTTAKSKNGKSAFRRYQMAFTFYDGCGTQMTVWVSGGHNKTPGDLFATAYVYAEGTLTANGCFPK